MTVTNNDTTYETVMHTLNEHCEEVCQKVTETLFHHIPVVGISQKDDEKLMHHHENMARTAHRFHEIVQTGATIDWILVSAEFGWADRKLSTMGVTHTHHHQMIDIYFTEAKKIRVWTETERALLDEIADNLRRAVQQAYEANQAAQV